jgi:hypothetical protein
LSTQISLVSGLLSNLFFALRAISAKGVMASPLGKSLSPTNMYGLLTLQSLALLLPLALLIEGPQLAAGTAATIAELGGKWPFVRMLLATGVTHYVYNECAFIALSAVHPVTHAVANTVKRVAVIVITVRRPARCPPPPLTARRPRSPPAAPAHRPPPPLTARRPRSPPASACRRLAVGSSSRFSCMQVIYFRNPMTLLGTTGTTMAILGVLLYSLAKARDDRIHA